jgi:hypothetical protein
MLAGSAEHGGEFVGEVLATSFGWGLESGSWVDDREDPRYSDHLAAAAADAKRWDAVQQQRRPLAFSCRGIRRRVESMAKTPGADTDSDTDSDTDESEDEDDESNATVSGHRETRSRRIRRRSVELMKAKKGLDELEPEEARFRGAVSQRVLEDEEDDDGDQEDMVEYIDKVGPLRVQNPSGKGWLDRWFVAEGGTISIYADDSRAELLAGFPCELCTCTEPKSKRDDAPAAFRIDVDTGKSSSHSGWMTKQGEHRKSWKRRWFQIQLQGTELAYYEKEGGKAKGAIDLAKCQSVRTHDEDVLQMVLLAMTDDGKYREYFFRCDNEDDCMMWVNAVNQSLARHLANMEQTPAGGVTVGAGFQKKYIVDPGDDDSKQAWFAALGGETSRTMQGLHRFGLEAMKGLKKGAADMAAQAAHAQVELLGSEDSGEGLNLELLTAGRRTVLQVCHDNDVKSCAGFRAEDREQDPRSGDPYVDLEVPPFCAYSLLPACRPISSSPPAAARRRGCSHCGAPCCSPTRPPSARRCSTPPRPTPSRSTSPRPSSTAPRRCDRPLPLLRTQRPPCATPVAVRSAIRRRAGA